MKSCFRIILVSILLTACNEGDRERRYENAAEEIKTEDKDLLSAISEGEESATEKAALVLKKFRQLYLDSMWLEAALLADSATINFFRKAIRLANTADSLTLNKEPVAKRFYTVYIRHRFEQKEIATLTPQHLLACILEKGVIINRAIEDAGEGFDKPITADEDRVCGYMARTVNSFCFNKENGKWLINFPHFFEQQTESMERGAEYRNIPLNDHFKYILAEITDYAEAKNPLWKRPR